MITYTVEDLASDGHRFSLRDEHGQLHVASARGQAPALDAGLLGQEAALGARVLVDGVSHTPLQACFEAIGCTQGQALDLLHPTDEPAQESACPRPFGAGAAGTGRRSDPSRAGRTAA